MPVDPGCNSDEDFEFVCGCVNALIVDSHVILTYIIAGEFNLRPNSMRLEFIINCLVPHRVIRQLVTGKPVLIEPAMLQVLMNCYNLLLGEVILQKNVTNVRFFLTRMI
jgi:hypothetical protein